MSAPHISQIGAFIAARLGSSPAATPAGTRQGTGYDRLVLGESCVLVAATGAVTGSPTAQGYEVTLQHSSDNGEDDAWTDYVPAGSGSASVQLAAANAFAEKDVDLGAAKQFVRVLEATTLTGGTAPSLHVCSFIVFGGAMTLPV
ncbi:hypothetical protein D7Y13_01475 [Corallococcus praedator]|uniref:Head decoration protein n=1 Tax=Corallococcus praedator TaxID=2316724 RepID=A0ABX9QRY5_9BACT|nr:MULTISPECIES: hypothetical protein [Corallococcus]RKH34928.1 hypothetical protein D7X75_06330 [Corallococcus sp. CA031C]RKI17128.1 hypothetical protein D7Y13_01475 [Corallococcus praedator]